MVKERDELFNNKTVDTAGKILIWGPSKRPLAVINNVACAGEVQEVVLYKRTYIWPGHFSDENVVLNAAKTGNAKNNNFFTVCSHFVRERERKTSQYNVNWFYKLRQNISSESFKYDL